MQRVLLLVAFVIAFGMIVLAGTRVATHSPLSPFYIPRWQVVDDQMEQMFFVSEEGVGVALYRFPTDEYALRFAHDQEAHRVSGWAEKIEDAVLTANGVYFTETYDPAGALILDGKELGSTAFDLDKSGYIVLQPTFDIVNTQVESLNEDELIEAGQSYPFLIWDGKAAVEKDSGLTARRTFIGQDESGFVYFGVVPSDEVSLYELAHVLLEVDVSWQAVMNLDGGPSTGLAARTQKRTELFNSVVSVPNVIIVERKP